MTGLTPRQLLCARVIHELIVAQGYAPSYTEIMAEMEITSRSQIHWLIHSLRERGWLTMMPGRGRSIQLLRVPPPLSEPECEVEITYAGRTYLALRERQ